MPFKYRLEKVLKLREGELDQAILEMKRAEEHLKNVSMALTETIERRNDLHAELINEGISHATLYVNSINQLNDQIDQLEQKLKEAQEELIQAKTNVVEAQKRLEALKKHKEKKHKEYLEEEKKIEAKMLDEIGVLKHARELLEAREE